MASAAVWKSVSVSTLSTYPSSRSLSTSPNSRILFELLSLFSLVSRMRMSVVVKKANIRVLASATDRNEVAARKAGIEILGCNR
jgi:hypothetical protein